jgi:hypothetical protein
MVCPIEKERSHNNTWYPPSTDQIIRRNCFLFITNTVTGSVTSLVTFSPTGYSIPSKSDSMWPPIDNCTGNVQGQGAVTTYDPSMILHQREPRFILLRSPQSIFPLLDTASPLSIASPAQSKKASMS